MRLLKVVSDDSFSLATFAGDVVPPYAILSHTWGRGEDHEVTFEDIIDGTGKSKEGFKKLKFCGDQARAHGLEYFWVDTCCINKASSSELTEAINSMFRWYQRAERCYVYLADVSLGTQDDQPHAEWESAFRNSRWFTRGWTLQELLAPQIVEFFTYEGRRLGDKDTLGALVHEATHIAMDALRCRNLTEFSFEERLRWANNRQTTKPEDKAYSMLGICGVYLPLIYGEGSDNAMRRLMNEVADKDSDVHKKQANTPPVPFSTVPFHRDGDFIVRGDLEQIHSRCSQPPRRVALVGLGGVGKSQLAIEYAHRVREQSPQTWVF